MNLQDIALTSYNSQDGDKHKHHFQGTTHFQRYQKHLEIFKDDTFNFLEIGISAGHSLHVWEAFFQNATIYGIDIANKSQHARDRIKTRMGNQIDDTFMNSVGEEAGKFKVILDDGSHLGEHMIHTLKTMWKFLEPGGFYIIEDMGTTRDECIPLKHWPGWKEGGFSDLATEDKFRETDNQWGGLYDNTKSRDGIDKLINECMESMDNNLYRTENFVTSPLGDYPVECITYYPAVIIIQKALNK